MKTRIFAFFLCLSLLLSGCVRQELPQPESAPEAGGSDSLSVHFINVGQADCALVECGGAYMLIDGGNKADGSLVISYLEQQGVEELDYVICTHAHEDHAGGLPSVLAVYPTRAVYAPTKTYSSKIYDDFLYYVDQQELEVTIPAVPECFNLGDAEITIFGPTKSYADTNNTSIVLEIRYGDTSFLFTGDMEIEAENDILDYWGLRVDWTADVLKVGHHGSNTSTGYRFLNAVMPTYGVISVGADNSYGHPHEEPLSRLKQAGVILLRTDQLGTILAVSDGTQVTFTWGNQAAAPDDVESGDAAVQTYIGNKNSKKFHAPDCASLPKEENRVTFSSYDDAVNAGYTPCGSCLG